MGALSSLIGAKEREQTVWTPPYILDAVDALFPDGWADRYPSEGSPATLRADPRVIVPCADANELAPWPGRSFCNPEYRHLQTHMQRAANEWHEFAAQSVSLIPLRTKRTWWCRGAEGASVAYLKPVVFIDPKTGGPYRCVVKRTGKLGPPAQYPESLVMLYWGYRKSLFRHAFAGISNHIQEEF